MGTSHWLTLGRVPRRFGATGCACVLLLFGLGGACTEEQPQGKAPAPRARVIAALNGREIPESRFEAYLRLGRADLDDDALQAPREQLFREFLVEQLLLEAAEKENISVSDAELKQRLGGRSPNDAETSEATQQRLRDYLRVQKFLRQKIAGQLNVSLKEMQNYYRDHQGEFVVDDQAHVLEILTLDESSAREVRKKLRPRNFRAFRQAAQTYSKGLSAKAGGDLGRFERGQLPEEFEKVIFALQPGSISEVFRSGHGFHIFMVEEFFPRHAQGFHEVERMIFERLLAQKERAALDSFSDELLKKASIEIRDPDLKLKWRNQNGDGNP